MKNKKNMILNVIIIVLTVVVFIMAIRLAIDTSPRGHMYRPDSAETMLRYTERGKYADLINSKYYSTMSGILPSGDNAYAVPYAAADYCEAAFNYRGLSLAGDTKGASQYADKMATARQALGQYDYIADNIDDFLK